MQITWLGHSAFRLQGKTASDIVSVVTDPYKSEFTGLKMPRVEADIVTISHDHDDHNNLEAIKGEPFVLRGPGEYESKGVYIDGISSYHDNEKGAKRGENIIFRFEIEDIVVTHLGDLGAELDDKQLERLEGTDILLIPVGGNFTLDAQKAVSVINQIEPRIIIPMHYKVPGLKFDLDAVEKFLKAIAIKPRQEEKLKISKKDLPQDNMELVVLSF
ncbi:MAG: MBL fold metallo-hydrolase [Candidatus Falkowbacteria bacterium]|nr:MBL fold metallo-hydrolase [Candidatus Falkowbacteria bacterium]